MQQRLQEGEYANLHLHITLSVIVHTDVAGTLLAIAESGKGMEEIKGFQGCDMLAMATHGRGGLAHWVMGSITERVLGNAKLPLIIVRPPQMVPRNEETSKPQSKSKKEVILF